MPTQPQRALDAELSDFDAGFLVGILVGEGHFGGDGRQPQVTLRMHVDHEALFRWLMARFPESRLYGPYDHSGPPLLPVDGPRRVPAAAAAAPPGRAPDAGAGRPYLASIPADARRTIPDATRFGGWCREGLGYTPRSSVPGLRSASGTVAQRQGSGAESTQWASSAQPSVRSWRPSWKSASCRSCSWAG